jgi:hypothetical protein
VTNDDHFVPPHCDQQILHAPGECDYCDEQPQWQALRKLWGIAFTGHLPIRVLDPPFQELPCPSDWRRPLGLNQAWPGNQAQSK